MCSEVVNEYASSMRELASEILEMLGEGLGLEDVHGLSKFIRDTENDSLLRFNHYTVIQQADEPYNNHNHNHNHNNNNPSSKSTTRNSKIGFGDHSDPQIITVLHSNDVPGLQILASSADGPVWVPVPPDPTAFYLIVGDALRVCIFTVVVVIIFVFFVFICTSLCCICIH